jgi:hypothetical protein
MWQRDFVQEVEWGERGVGRFKIRFGFREPRENLLIEIEVNRRRYERDTMTNYI